MRFGTRIPFLNRPTDGFCLANMIMSEKLMRICDEEVKALLDKKAIVEIPLSEQNCVSGIFVIPKSSGGYRPITNLKLLNRSVKPQHFKMEGIGVLKDLVRKGDYFCKMDLKDAYLTIPLHEEDQKFLQIKWREKLYQFSSLCFGLASAPWAFTKLLRPVVSFLRKQGMRLIIYLDDILFLNQSEEGVEQDFLKAVRVLEACGFLVNFDKSIGKGTKIIEYLGLMVNSENLSLSLLSKKVEEIKKLCTEALRAHSVALRDIARILGNFAWAIQAIPFAQAHLRAIQHLYIEHANRRNEDLRSQIVLDEASRQDLEWWKDNLEMGSGKSIAVGNPDLTIYSDASLTGWGAALNGALARGPWKEEDRHRHINELELLAALFALQSFTARASNVTIQLMLDNRTAVAYVNKSGGTRSEKLRIIASEIVHWCEDRGITLSAVYLPGALNVLADRLSRMRLDASDWKLNPDLFRRLQSLWSPQVDLFASRWNRQLDQFVSWHHQPEAMAVDAFSLNWGLFLGYAFPPFGLIQRCLNKIRKDRAEMILVAPVWPAQPWYPVLMGLACEPPRIFQPSDGILLDPSGCPHPLMAHQSLTLAAWRLSGIATRPEAFRTRWSNFSWEQTVIPQQLHTKAPGTVGVLGVYAKIRIPCLLI